MKVLINISDEIYRHAKDGSEDSNDEWNAMRAIADGTPIPDNATNGDVIKAMFGVEEVDMSNTYCVHFPEEEEDYGHYFFKEWWNAPYQKGNLDE